MIKMNSIQPNASLTAFKINMRRKDKTIEIQRTTRRWNKGKQNRQ